MAGLEAVSTQQVKEGSPSSESIGEFVKAHRDQAYSIALRITHAPADAEDAVQDAGLRFLSRRAELPELAQCQALFYRAVVQCALDLSRKDSRREQREAAFCQMGSEAMRSQEPAGDLAERGETLQVLRQAVVKLPEEERLPVALCVFEGLSVADTARSLDLPRETVRARLRRAMDKLRGSLRGSGSGKGRNAGVAVILALLWRDGCQPASASLCARLDSILPGRPCSQIEPVEPQARLAGKEFQSNGALIKPALATIAAVSLVSAAWLWHASRITTGPERGAHITPPHASAGPNSTGEQAAAAQHAQKSVDMVPAETAAPAGPQKKPLDQGAAEAGKPASVQVDEPQGDVTASVREIEARKAEKTEARSREAANRVKWQQAEIHVLTNPATGERVLKSIEAVPPPGAPK